MSSTNVQDKLHIIPLCNIVERFVETDSNQPIVVTGLIEQEVGKVHTHYLLTHFYQPDGEWYFCLVGMVYREAHRLIKQFQKLNKKQLSLKFDTKWLRFDLVDDDFEVLEMFYRYMNGAI